MGSTVKLKLLRLFRKESSLSVSEAARRANVSKSRASECLKELALKGVLESRAIGKNVIYSPASTVLAKRIIESLHSEEGLSESISGDFLKAARKIKPISIAIFGSSLYGIKLGSDMDFFVISDKKEPFYKIASELTEKFGIPVSVFVIGKKEFRQKAKRGEEFAINVLANYKLIRGKRLEEVVWQGK